MISYFAVEAFKLCDSIKGHYSIVNQLERSATSIGANIHEANYAQSKPDFIAKLQIALKECYETEYWLELFVKSELIDKENVKKIFNNCNNTQNSDFFYLIKHYDILINTNNDPACDPLPLQKYTARKA